MRVGFISLYSWRPHVEQLAYLARLAAQGGVDPRFLTCDANLPTCYTRQLRPQRPAAVECSGCRLAGIRSFEGHNVVSIGALRHGPPDPVLVARGWGSSSASTLGRFESDEDYATSEFGMLENRMNVTAAIGYEAARNWIAREKLEAVVGFNGRIDATRGVYEAAKDAGIRYISVERTWFGDGLQLYPDETCMGLRNMHRVVADWADAALTRVQAHRAAVIVAARFMKNNHKEWRAYNTSSTMRSWSAEGRRRVLLIPGSRNEVRGSPDYADGWPSRTAAYDALIEHLDLRPQDLILRAHPSWGEKIGRLTGARSERYYHDWAAARGIAFIPSADTTSTLGLIEQADAIVVAGGSAALEAGIIGKRIIALTSSAYSTAGFEERAYGASELAAVRPLGDPVSTEQAREIARRTLRFCYTVACRIPQYVDYIRCVTPTNYQFVDGADPRRFVDLVRNGRLLPDDAASAATNAEEDRVLDLVEARDWAALTAWSEPTPVAHRMLRRMPFRPVDSLRARLPTGDR